MKNIWIHYRLTREAWKALFIKQGGLCAGCKKEIAHAWDKQMKMGLRPEVDHCHVTGKVRGLLCRGCNDFLGKIADDKGRLQNLIDYLKRNGDW